MSGREIVESGRTVEQVSHSIEIRFLRGLNSDRRIKHDGRTFNIESVTDVGERKREMLILAKERP